jgi:hypothetical protein
MADHTPYQKKIIKRFYDHADDIGYQRLAELVSEIYLAEGKKLDNLWKQVEKALAKVKVDQAMTKHIMDKRDPKVLADAVAKLARG